MTATPIPVPSTAYCWRARSPRTAGAASSNAALFGRSGDTYATSGCSSSHASIRAGIRYAAPLMCWSDIFRCPPWAARASKWRACGVCLNWMITSTLPSRCDGKVARSGASLRPSATAVAVVPTKNKTARNKRYDRRYHSLPSLGLPLNVGWLTIISPILHELIREASWDPLAGVVVLGAPHCRGNHADAVSEEVADQTGFRE